MHVITVQSMCKCDDMQATAAAAAAAAACNCGGWLCACMPRVWKDEKSLMLLHLRTYVGTYGRYVWYEYVCTYIGCEFLREIKVVCLFSIDWPTFFSLSLSLSYVIPSISFFFRLFLPLLWSWVNKQVRIKSHTRYPSYVASSTTSTSNSYKR